MRSKLTLTIVIEYLEQANKLIASGSSVTPSPIIDKTLKELNKRNKLVKLADKSEAGWLAVDEYLADDLASDSDDDKKIRSAQARASAKKKKNASNKNRAKPYQRKTAQASPPNPASQLNSGQLFCRQSAFNNQGYYYGRKGFSGGSSFGVGAASFSINFSISSTLRCITLIDPSLESQDRPNQSMHVVGVHTDFTAFGTSPAANKSSFTLEEITLHASSDSALHQPSSRNSTIK